jgi:hypothetical protein
VALELRGLRGVSTILRCLPLWFTATIYDEDPTNDPLPREACVSDDILGMCPCYFGGPSVDVTIEGTTPLVP